MDLPVRWAGSGEDASGAEEVTETVATVLLCYAAVGIFVWLAGDGLGDAVSQPLCRTAAEFVAVVLAWPWLAWRALRHWRGR